MTRSALLLIDLQRDFLARPGLQPPQELLVERISAALADARARGEPVFHVRTDGARPMPHRAAAPEAVAGTPGADPPEALRERAGERVFTKRFFSTFDAEGLEQALRQAGIDTLRLAGVHAHACVQTTALDAYARGFAVRIDPALVGSDRPVTGALALDWLDRRAASVGGTASAPATHCSPVDGEVLFEIAETGPAAVADAARSLQRARLGWTESPIADRAAALSAWVDQIDAGRDRFVEALVTDLGKPRRDAVAEIDYGLALARSTLAALAALADEDPRADRDVRYRPRGTIGLLSPWNNPFAIPLGKLVPTLAYGNAVLWKPAPAGTGLGRMIADSIADHAFAEAIRLVTGGAESGRALVGAVDAVALTGSVATGQAVAGLASGRGIALQAELGGCNAAIVDASADLDHAAADLAAAMFSFAGQRCTAIRRVIVDSAVADRFVPRLVAAVDALVVGDPGDPATECGPVIDDAARRRIARLAEVGGHVLTRPRADLPERGAWLAPVLLGDVPPDHPLLGDEQFGPVAAVIVAEGIDRAIAVHNATRFGLLGAIYGRDEVAIARFAKGAEAALLSVNRARPAFAPDGPFFGWKDSALGSPEHGRWARDFATRVQALYR